MDLLLKIWERTGRSIWYKLFDTPPLIVFGRIIVIVTPASLIHSAIDTAFKKRSFWAELVLAGYNEKYKQLSSEEMEKLNRDLIWGNLASSWHQSKLDEYKNDFEGNFLEYKNDLINELKQLNLREYTLIEVGCGNGVFLDYLSENVEAQRYIGFDISKDIIDFDRKIYLDKNLEFYNIDIFDYIKLGLTNKTIFIFSGVLLYFTQEFLEQLIGALQSEEKHVIIALNEIVSNDFEESNVSYSKARFGFSHNYPYVLRKYQWLILYSKFLEDIKRVNIICSNREQND